MAGGDDIKRKFDDLRYRALSTPLLSDPSKRPMLYGIGAVVVLAVVFLGVRLLSGGGAEEVKLPPGSEYVSRAVDALREDPRFASVTVLASGPEGNVRIVVYAILPGAKEEAELRQKLEALGPPGPIEITRESPAAGKKK